MTWKVVLVSGTAAVLRTVGRYEPETRAAQARTPGVLLHLAWRLVSINEPCAALFVLGALVLGALA
jgi:hypothetical protein